MNAFTYLCNSCARLNNFLTVAVFHDATCIAELYEYNIAVECENLNEARVPHFCHFLFYEQTALCNYHKKVIEKCDRISKKEISENAGSDKSRFKKKGYYGAIMMNDYYCRKSQCWLLEKETDSSVLKN